MAQQSESPIIHVPLMCGIVRTGRTFWRGRKGLQLTTVAARFWAKVDIKSVSECWLWTAARQGGRYGYIRIAKQPHGAHRVAWELANGREIPFGWQVNHHCDESLCCNPAHLYLGTQQQNVLDAIDRGRHVNPNWRLRKHVRNGYTKKAVA